MLKTTDIEKFYSKVNSLNLKFPVATIAKATGFSKGNVSDYLNKKKEPSENFINKFHECFPESSKNVPRNTVSTGNKEVGPDDKILLRLLMEQMTNLMRTQNNLLQEQKDQVVDKVNAVDTNLKKALQGVSKLVLHVESARVVVLDSLSRIEKKAPGSLRKEADKIMDQLEGQQMTHGMSGDDNN